MFVGTSHKGVTQIKQMNFVLVLPALVVSHHLCVQFLDLPVTSNTDYRLVGLHVSTISALRVVLKSPVFVIKKILLV